MKYIRIHGKRYYYHSQYNHWKQAYKNAKKIKKEHKCRTFILPSEEGLWFPTTKYNLYANKQIRIW